MPDPSAPADARGGQPLPPSSELSSSRWNLLAYVPALVPLALTITVVLVIVRATGFQNFGLSFWSFNSQNYGIMIFVVGSFLSSVPALLLAMGIGLGIAIASTTYLPRLVSAWLDPFVDLLAGIPSIVYGLWGWYVLAPLFGGTVYPWSTTYLAWIPGFAANRNAPAGIGEGLGLAIVVLTLMILPITTLLMRDALRAVPRDLWESGLALGATPWEVTRRVAVPYSKRGIWGAAFLGFGRAIGETVAVFMVIGQLPRLPTNVYDGTTTMASLIIGSIDAAFITNPSGVAELHFLAELALVLLAITLAVNIAGRWIVRRTFTEVAGV